MSRRSRLRPHKTKPLAHIKAITCETLTRVRLKISDPHFPSKLGQVLSAETSQDGSTVLRLALILDNKGIRRPVVRRALADVIPLMPDESRLPAPRREIDANPYMDMFG